MTMTDSNTFAVADSGAAWGLTDLQRAELAEFRTLGFPSDRGEHWRYTPTKALATFTEQLLHDDGHREPDDAADIDRLLSIFPAAGKPAPEHRIVFRNGLWHREALAAALQPIQRTSTALGAADSALAALNGARAATTLHLRLDEASRPLTIVHILDGAAPLLAAPRLEIEVAANASVDIDEFLLQVPGSAPVFNNALTTVNVDRGGSIAYRRLQLLENNSHSVAETRVALAAGAALDWFTLDTGAALARNDVRVTLDGRDADAKLAGVFATNGRQHVDNRLRVHHAAPGATSRQEYAGLAGDDSSAVYHGKVLVAAGADGTHAEQHNRNLLLSDRASIYTKPELEIYADEVSCAHGATTGQLDPAALFYLQSRGIASADARRLLTEAFVAAALAPLTGSPLAERVDRLLYEKLGTMLTEARL